MQMQAHTHTHTHTHAYIHKFLLEDEDKIRWYNESMLIMDGRLLNYWCLSLAAHIVEELRSIEKESWSQFDVYFSHNAQDESSSKIFLLVSNQTEREQSEKNKALI